MPSTDSSAIAFLDAIPDSRWEPVMGSQDRPTFAALVVDGGGDVETEWRVAQVEAGVQTAGILRDYRTNAAIRPATADELRDSIETAKRDGGSGVIDVDGQSCYVED